LQAWGDARRMTQGALTPARIPELTIDIAALLA
jgi:hypothetical protein